jgi:hypoxanthine-guanine phosphoribosyltransferase
MPETVRKILYTEPQIRKKVEQISRSVLTWLGIIDTNVLNLFCILESAKPLTRDLMAFLKKNAPSIQINLYEINVSNAAGDDLLDKRWQEGSPDLNTIRKYPVLIVDGLMDTGKTMKKIKNHLLYLGVTDWQTVVFIRKFGVDSGSVDFLGFDLSWDREEMVERGYQDWCVYGYGMDLKGQKRELPYVETVFIPIKYNRLLMLWKDIMDGISVEGWIIIAGFVMGILYAWRVPEIKFFFSLMSYLATVFK